MVQSSGGSADLPGRSERPARLHLNLAYCKGGAGWNLQFPPDIDVATKEHFKEIANICLIIPPNSVTGAILTEQWQKRWKKVKEDTSSSYSGLHSGHYIAGADCDYISQFRAL